MRCWNDQRARVSSLTTASCNLRISLYMTLRYVVELTTYSGMLCQGDPSMRHRYEQNLPLRQPLAREERRRLLPGDIPCDAVTPVKAPQSTVTANSPCSLSSTHHPRPPAHGTERGALPQHAVPPQTKHAHFPAVPHRVSPAVTIRRLSPGRLPCRPFHTQWLTSRSQTLSVCS